MWREPGTEYGQVVSGGAEWSSEGIQSLGGVHSDGGSGLEGETGYEHTSLREEAPCT